MTRVAERLTLVEAPTFSSHLQGAARASEAELGGNEAGYAVEYSLIACLVPA